MDCNFETLQFLSDCFVNTISPLPEPRRSAEAALAEAARRPNYGPVVLRLVAEQSVPEQIRLSAAINFKNYLKAHWALHPDDPARISLPDPEKEHIKALIVPLMVGSSPKIQAQLSEALTIIGEHDFPKAWPDLLPGLAVKLDELSRANDYASVNGILATVRSLFKKFRCRFKTNDLLLELKYCLDNFAKPLLDLFKRTASFIDQVSASGASNVNVLRGYIESQKLCCRIFYSLNYMDLPEFFEDHMDEWLTEFRKYLIAKYDALEDGGNDGLALFDELRASVCVNISLFVEREEDFFRRYLDGFVEAVWRLLSDSSNSSSREKLTVFAIKFLTTVSMSVHHTMFAGDECLQQIFHSIVIPNVMLGAEDEEHFDMNYVEFIRRDMEGSDLYTRRWIACELLKGIAKNYKENVTRTLSNQVQSLLTTFEKNPSGNWKHKDCAIYLVVSLATKRDGGNSTSTDIVDVESFFQYFIVPELRSQDVDGFLGLKAAALKFFTVFRNQISKPVALALLPDVVRFLGSKSNVVHSYAATCIENLLLVQDEGGIARYSAVDVQPFLLALLTNLFNALQKPESEENEYVMKCIMRVLGVAIVSREVALPCIGCLTNVLNRVCENPKNPAFNQFLLESVALLVGRACEQDPSVIAAFESSLLPSVQMILSRDVSEFIPYTFLLLTQLVSLSQSPLPGNYMEILMLLLPESWKKYTIVKAIVPFLQAFLRKAPHELSQPQCLTKILGIFEALVSSHSTDVQGFYVLNAVIENVSYDVISQYMRDIWVVLFKRLRLHMSIKFAKCLIIFMSLFLVKHGPENLSSSMNKAEPGMFHIILGRFLLPIVLMISGGSKQLESTALASTTRFSCESLSPNIWGKMLGSIVALISRTGEDCLGEVPDFSGIYGCETKFDRLYSAWWKEEDPLREIDDPKQFLVSSLTKLSARRYPGIITQKLEQEDEVALLQLCNSFNLTIE